MKIIPFHDRRSKKTGGPSRPMTKDHFRFCLLPDKHGRASADDFINRRVAIDASRLFFLLSRADITRLVNRFLGLEGNIAEFKRGIYRGDDIRGIDHARIVFRDLHGIEPFLVPV
jgi:hypothetical protein